ncbi:MAG: UDP-N-acetylmuramate--L-alanine ligase [Planctomycetes bacterium]|nr:UDP-N-acetylmuramate--L-alanine ligase [Planctomycetota bacterium]
MKVLQQFIHSRLAGPPRVGKEGKEMAIEQVHMIGIAGSGLRGMAGILAQLGIQVSGSEIARSSVLDRLQHRGIACSIGHRRENVPSGTQLVLISAAIQEDNPELQEALRRGLPVLKYSELLGMLMRQRSGIAVAGTHGKTTTTAMTVQALQDAGLDPSFLIGGDYPRVGGSAGWGSGDLFVAEACEFDRSFLKLYPKYAIITNVEEDHLDYFHSLGEIQGAFSEFVQHLPKDGYLVLNGDDANSQVLANKTFAGIGWFSLRGEGGDWWAEKIRTEAGGVAFQAVSRSGERVDLSLKIPGIHNVKNALAVTVLMRQIGLPMQSLFETLSSFTGVRRRFEFLCREPAFVIDDYAHHPTEIEMVLRAARETFSGRRLRVVFQPHQYSRTYRFLYGFAQILATADEAMVMEVYAARDSLEDMRRVSSANLVEAVNQLSGRAIYLKNQAAVLDHVLGTFAPGEVFLFLGAGDITNLAHQVASLVVAQPVGVPVEGAV